MAWYGAIVFLTSAGALVVEIVAARLVAPYAGSSLYTWTAIIAAVLAGLSVGHWIGGRLAGPEVDARRGERRMAAALALAGLSSIGALALLRLLADAAARSSVGAFVAVTLLGAVLFFAPSLFAGIVSPIATKLAVDLDPRRTGPAIGTMSAAGAVGSILGTVLAGFVLVQWLGSSATLIWTAALYAALAVVLVATRPRTLVLVAPAIAVAAIAAPRLAAPCQVESAYYCINVLPGNAVSGRESRFLMLNQLMHSHADRDDPGRLLLGY
ncbi:MAG: fused MFS/spermidine synthase, partial [Alphaproteobacteria bacterium]